MSHKMVTCHPEEDVQKVLDARSEIQLRRIFVGISAQAVLPGA